MSYVVALPSYSRPVRAVYADRNPEITPRPGLGAFWDTVFSFGSQLLGAKSAEGEAKQIRKGQEAQARAYEAAAKATADAQVAIAQSYAGIAEKAAGYEYAAADVASRRQLMAMQAQYAALGRAQQLQRSAQSEQLTSELIAQQQQLSSSLVAQTQSGIFGLSATGISAAASTSQSYAKWATVAAIGLVGFFFWAATRSEGKKKGSFRSDIGGFFGRQRTGKDSDESSPEADLKAVAGGAK